MNLTLSIVHHIFLTKEERYALAKGLPVEVAGVSSPVWSSETFTTEPAEEIFCKYVFINNGDPGNVERTKDGYLVTLASKPKVKTPPRPSNEVWFSVPIEAREAWYEKYQQPPTVKNLVDVKDGGAAYFRFKFHKKMKYKEHSVNIFHYMELKDMETLKESIV